MSRKMTTVQKTSAPRKSTPRKSTPGKSTLGKSPLGKSARNATTHVGDRTTTIPTAVLGATGYVGGELLRLLAGHPTLDPVAAVSGSRAGSSIAASFPHLASAYGDTRFIAHDKWLQQLDRGSKLAVFSAAPHGASAAMVARLLEQSAARDLDVHVVDASADFRFPDRAGYEAVYGVEHGAPALLEAFQSGVPEHVPEVTAQHAGNPGCFATAVLLAAVPLLDAGVTEGAFFVTGITGSTGSGNKPQAGTHHPERHSNLYAYKALAHRHAPEIRALATAATGRDWALNFVPHSGPFARGIFVTLQAAATAPVDDIRRIFKDYYSDATFVDIVEGSPKLKHVVASNRAHIGVATNETTVVVMCAIDNLVKGAAGGAIQWMNRLWQLPETAGLTAPAPAWT